LARLRLGDVGAGSLANLEARARGAHLFRQELQVALRQHRDLAVADDVHVGARRIEQRVLLGVAQRFVRGPDPRLGGGHIVLLWKPSNSICRISTPNSPKPMRVDEFET